MPGNTWTNWEFQQIENTKKYQRKSTEVKHKITELKNLKEEFNSTIDQVEQKISKLENRAVESIQLEEQKESEDSLVALWENIK